MSDTYNYPDIGGVFPAQDGVEQTTTVGTPVGYDLSRLMSTSMRERPPWFTMAVATSNVFYEYVEQQRIALELAREPENLSQVLQVATLRMLGIEINADYVPPNNGALQRLLENAQLYLANSGTADFVAYLGYCLGFVIELQTLWTQDYQDFTPFPSLTDTENDIFDFPLGAAPETGVWYPTSHVALLYEEFAPNAPTPNDLLQLEYVFYQMAPINLVLLFIGTVVTGYIGPLQMGLQQFEKEYAFATAQLQPEGVLFLSEQPFESSVDTAVCYPYYPDNTFDAGFAVITMDTGVDNCTATSSSVDWKAPLPLNDTGVQFGGGYVVPSTTVMDGQWTASYLSPANLTEWGMFETSYQGLLVQRTMSLLLNASGDPTSSSWVPAGVNIQQTFTRYDGVNGFNVATLYAGGSVSSGNTAFGTDCVVLAFRPRNTTRVDVTRGLEGFFVDVATMTVTATDGALASGIYPIGSGFFVAWARLPGESVSVYPGGVVGSGDIDWLDFQVIQGSTYPSPLPSTDPTSEYTNRGTGTYWNVDSILAQLVGAGNTNLGLTYQEIEAWWDLGSLDTVMAVVDLGSVPTTVMQQLQVQTQTDLGSVVTLQSASTNNFLDITTGSVAMGSVTDATIIDTYALGSVASSTTDALFLGFVYSRVTPPLVLVLYELTVSSIVDLGPVTVASTYSSDLGSVTDGLPSPQVDLGWTYQPLDPPLNNFNFDGYSSWNINLTDDLGLVSDVVPTLTMDLGTLSGPLPYFDLGRVIQTPAGDASFQPIFTPNIESILTDMGAVAAPVTSMIDFGYVIQPPQIGMDYGGSAMFPGGVAFTNGIDYLATAPQTKVVDGTIVTTYDPATWQQPYGVFEVEVISVFDEWSTITQEIARLVDFGSNGLYFYSVPGGVQAVLWGAVFNFAATDNVLRIGVSWSPTGTIMYVNDDVVQTGAPLVNLSQVLLFGGTLPVNSTWLIRRIFALGSTYPSVLPDTTLMSTFVGGIAYQMQNLTMLDFGPIAGPGSGPYLESDYGFTTSAVTLVLDMGIIT